MQAAVTPAKVPVLVVSPDPDDHIQLGTLLQRESWEMRHVATCEEAQAILHRMPISVVISESESAGVSWRKLLAVINRVPFQSKPHLVVVSAKADDRLWSEVLNLGGYNVLAKPFEAAEVSWVLENAHVEYMRWTPDLVCQECQRLSA